MFVLTAFGDICIAIAAFAAGAYAWPWIHQKFVGAEAYAQALRDRASAVISAARGK